MKIGIIGKGNVGSAIGKGLANKGHEVKFGHRDPREPVIDAARWGEVIILAVPHDAVEDVVKEIGSVANEKTLLDVTNAITENWDLSIEGPLSAAERLQKLVPKARVVKAFNTVFAVNQGTGKIGKEQLTLFVASDDVKAKQTIMQLGIDIGFDAVDAGMLKSARYLEGMAVMLMYMAFVQGMGTGIGYKLVKA
jgi:predicted dinucleotide-binding enzyme